MKKKKNAVKMLFHNKVYAKQPLIPAPITSLIYTELAEFVELFYNS